MSYLLGAGLAFAICAVCTVIALLTGNDWEDGAMVGSAACIVLGLILIILVGISECVV